MATQRSLGVTSCTALFVVALACVGRSAAISDKVEGAEQCGQYLELREESLLGFSGVQKDSMVLHMEEERNGVDATLEASSMQKIVVVESTEAHGGELDAENLSSPTEAYYPDAPAGWTRIFACVGGSGVTVDLPSDIQDLAAQASRIKICTAGSSSDCAVSKPNTFPIERLRQGKMPISHNGGYCDGTCVRQAWEDNRRSDLWSNCVGSDSGDFFYHACGNSGALHIKLNGQQCFWKSGGSLEVFIDKPTPSPTEPPSPLPTALPTTSPTESPSPLPTALPTTSPTEPPSPSPTALPTTSPSTTTVPTKDFTYSGKKSGSSYLQACSTMNEFSSMNEALDGCKESGGCAGVFSFGSMGKKFRMCTSKPKNNRRDGQTHWFCPLSDVEADGCAPPKAWLKR